MEIETDVPDFNTIAKELIDNTRRFARVHCVNHFKESFQKQGFTDQSLEPWDKRVSPDYRPGGALLVNTSFLRDSIKVVAGNKYQITFGSYAPYSKIHNEGGTLRIKITPKSRRFFWYMFKKTQVEKWKWMALSKKDVMTMKVPKRQFIGDSKVMMDGLEDWLFEQIVKKFQQIK